MRFAARFSWILVFLCLGVAFAQTQPGDERSLADIARETRERKRLNPPDTRANSAVVRLLIADMSANDPEEYAEQITELLSKRDFDGLEQAAERARSHKSRVPGGVLKLYLFYDSLGQPSGGRAGDADWNAHIGLLNEWVSRQPSSSTARIALERVNTK